MRLVCPNCGAQYEVADDVIPPTGRDVQCSNCGNTWFERPGASAALEDAIDDPSLSAPEPEPVPEPATEPEPEPASEIEAVSDQEPTDATQPDPAPEPQTEPEPEPEAEETETEAEADLDPSSLNQEPQPEIEASDTPDVAQDDELEDPAGDQPQKRELDPSVAEILRQEAEFEETARAIDNGSIESQPDLGLTADVDEDRRARESRERLARLRGEVEAAQADDSDATSAAIAATLAADASTPRRDMLPDIEEINSTLRPDASGAPLEDYPDEDLDPGRRGGFRNGFTFVIVLVLIALAVYIFAPQIQEAVPSTESALNAYVAWIDGLRDWLSDRITGDTSAAADPSDTVPVDDAATDQTPDTATSDEN